MHGILSYARFGQQKSPPGEKLRGYFDEIHDSGSRLMALLNDLLDLSKLEAGKALYSMREAELSDVAHAVRSELQGMVDEKGLNLEVTAADGGQTAAFDSERIHQVIRNLVSNAIKFSSPRSTIRVEVSGMDNLVRCSVVNQGVGIPEDELESVFDKFVQSSKTRSGSGGTGLGLAICREIVTQHGGRIWAEYAPGGAETRFIVELPRARTPSRHANAA